MSEKNSAMNALTAEEKAVFDGMYSKYYRTILGYIKKRVSDGWKAEDYASDTFLRAAAHIGEFSALPDGERLKLLYSYAGSVTLENERKLTSRKTYSFTDIEAGSEEDGEPFADCIDGGEDVQTEFVDRELVRAIKREIDALEPKKRRAILMRYGSEMKTADIAAEMKMNHSTLRRMLQSAVAELRKKLEDYRG